MEMKRNLGFTVIELIVAVTIVILLVAVAVASFQDHMTHKSRAQARKAMIEVAEWLQLQYPKSRTYLVKLPVTHPGVEQKATWLQVRQQRPDYVFLWGWGVMNSAAIREAINVSYPRLQMYGVWWSAAEPDTQPAEMAAKGYNGLAMQHSNEKNAGVHKDLLKFVHDKGKGTGDKKEIGNVLYNRGMLSAMLVVESVRQAQTKYGKKPLTGEQVRWGAENLNIDAARIKALGVDGIMQPLKTSCMDHEGARKARIHTWDGATWSYTSDWYEGDNKFLRPMVEAQAKKYAAEKKIEQRDCKKES